jgi:hypothetical protein
MQRDDVASVVVLTMKSVMAPLQERLAVLEARGADAAAMMGSLTAMRERLAALETKPQVPGPAGADGAPGKDGDPGAPGTAGLRFRKAYNSGQTYDPGDLVVWNWSVWHCNQPTDTRPGDGAAAWSLFAGGKAPR